MTAKSKRTHVPRHRHSEPPDGGDAFIPDVARSHERLTDDAAEAFAEEFIASATSAECVGEDARDEMLAEELGGPFAQLFAHAENDAFIDDDLGVT